MAEFPGEYDQTDDRNDRYRLLCEEMARLRGSIDEEDLFDREAVADAVRAEADRFEAPLVVFVANDFGLPVAYRPEGMDRERQDELRRAILESKYDADHDDLNDVRETLLEAHPRVHKAIVATLGEEVRYYLPEGSTTDTAFLTVREMVGLVDYTTNSDQAEGLSETY